MKTIMHPTLFSGLILLGMASVATAQQTPRSAGAQVNSVSTTHTIAPVATSMMHDGYGYVYSDKQINEADLKSKEVSKEIAIPKSGEIYIEISSRNVVIKTWDQQKVKVTTTVYFDGESNLTDDEWLEKANLSLKTLGTSVKIKSGNVRGNSFYTYNDARGAFGLSGGTAIFNGNGQNIGSKSNMKKIVTITVPSGSKVDIESKYADVTLPAGISDASVDITNGNLETENLNKLILRSKYSNANVGDIKTAELEFTNGRFTAKNIDDLDIDSKYSTIEMAAAKKLVLRSTNDEYEVEEAGEVRGRKSYGNLRITRLDGSLELDGTNADVKIRNVGPALSMIKLDDKYADIRIPLRNVKNYSVDFTGAYSSVYGNFEKVPVTEKTAEKTVKGLGSVVTATAAGTLRSSTEPLTVTGRLAPMYPLAPVGWSEGNSPSRFTAAVGDGKGLKIDIKCQNCTVDFK